MKNYILFSGVLALLVGQKSLAAEKSFFCNDGEISVQLNFDPVDPENAAGSLDNETLDTDSDLYQSTDLKSPKGTTLYLISGEGDGDTEFHYIAVPDSLSSANKGAKLAVTFIVKSDQNATPSNPLGISRNNVSCTVE